MSYIIEHLSEGVLLFKINRPEKRNAINDEVILGLEKVIGLAESKEVKVLVLTGVGDQAFCSGGDLSVFHELRSKEEAYEKHKYISTILKKLLFLPKPTIALLNGSTIGGGCEVATACDFRIGREGIKAGFIQGTLAITTAWGAGTMILEKLLPSNGLKMLMEASLFTTETLKEIGFLDYSFKGTDEEGLQFFIQNIMKIDSSVQTTYKEMLIRKWKASDLEKRIEEEVIRCAELWERDAHHEQVDKFLNRK